jgi:ABC-type Mn2+/Zn2+ transport system permease subunit
MAVLATIIGFYASYYADVASGPAIVLTLTVMFVFCGVYSAIRKVRQ